MTQIAKKQAEANLSYALASKIRELLDAARKEQGKTFCSEEWDALEAEVSELVFSE